MRMYNNDRERKQFQDIIITTIMTVEALGLVAAVVWVASICSGNV